MDVMTADSDSEFGYDFSAEEEELLLQLAASQSPAVPRTQLPPPTNDAKLAVIDAVPGQSDSSVGRYEPHRVASPAFSLDSLQTEYRVQDGPPTIVSQASSSHQTVCYPDQTSGWRLV